MRVLQHRSGQRPLTDFQAAFSRRQYFAWIQAILRIEQHLEISDHVERIQREQTVHQLVFLHPDAVLAGDRSAYGNAVRQNVFARALGFVEIARLVVIEQDDGMHVAVTGMKDVADGEAVAVGVGVEVAH